ncbi:MAG: EutN/CcmL family microcompartment protein, partial [Firmicutes bacterium]|nr:EutN/CcmL family microcompartment protein [Bacillota bacterium]
AGIGERVIVVSGSTARKAFGNDDIPADMAIVGIIDSVEIDRKAK